MIIILKRWIFTWSHFREWFVLKSVNHNAVLGHRDHEHNIKVRSTYLLESGNYVSLHLKVGHDTGLFFYFRQVYLVLYLQVFPVLIVPANENGLAVLAPSEDVVIARLQMVTVEFLEGVHDLLTSIEAVHHQASVHRSKVECKEEVVRLTWLLGSVEI